MHESIIMEAGLSLNEARIYETLVKTGNSSANTLSSKTNISRSNVYDAIARLCKRGLATELFIKKRKYYAPSHPRRLFELLEEKKERINSVISGLTKQYEGNKTTEQAYVHHGIEAYKNYMFDILEKKAPYYCIGGKGMWFDPRLKYFRLQYDRQRGNTQIPYHHIFDEEMKKQTRLPLKFPKNKFKFLPKKYCSKLTIEFFGDEVVIYTGEDFGKLKDEPTVFVIKSKEIAEGFKKIYEFFWDH